MLLVPRGVVFCKDGMKGVSSLNYDVFVTSVVVLVISTLTIRGKARQVHSQSDFMEQQDYQPIRVHYALIVIDTDSLSKVFRGNFRHKDVAVLTYWEHYYSVEEVLISLLEQNKDVPFEANAEHFLPELSTL